MSRLESRAHVLVETLKLCPVDHPFYKLDLTFSAHKFVVLNRDLNKEFAAFGHDLEVAKLFRMPFDVCLLEMIVDPDHRQFFLVQQLVGKGWQRLGELHVPRYVHNVELYERSNDDVQLLVHVFLMDGFVLSIESATYVIDMSNPPSREKSLYNWILRSPDHTHAPRLATFIRSTMYAFVALINSRSTRVTFYEPPAKLNKARLARRKVPLFSCTVLELPPIDAIEHPANGSRPHGSPRLHWRRGHLRRLGARIVPVAPCLVGCLENGAVAHLYEVKKHEQLRKVP